VLAASVALLLGVAVVANSLPAWRASRLDPMTTLQTE
jgi:ABC-type lipoprotein release transport system permease subunit